MAARPTEATGIGGPSTSIAVEELAQLGIRTFLRVGTTGAIQPDVAVADVIVTTGSVRMDGASGHFAPYEFPAVAHQSQRVVGTQQRKAARARKDFQESDRIRDELAAMGVVVKDGKDAGGNPVTTWEIAR